MKKMLPTCFYIISQSSVLLTLLILCPTISYANLIYQIDAGQSFDTDSSPISGYVIWDDSLSSITNWSIETVPGFGIHSISTEGASFDDSGLNDTVVGGSDLQTFYTTTPTASQELEIIWGTSPTDAAVTNIWQIKETWFLNNFPGTHWRTGSVSVTLVSTVPLPASVWLFGSGLLGLAGLIKRKSNRSIRN